MKKLNYLWAGLACSCVTLACGSSSATEGLGTDAGHVPLAVMLITPAASTVYTHGTVAVQVAVTGGAPDTMELLRDGSLLAALSPPYQYNWDTSSTPEGSYQLTARATQGDRSFTSEIPHRGGGPNAAGGGLARP